MIIRMLMFPVILLLVLYSVISLVIPTYQEITAEKTNIEAKMKTKTDAEQQLNQVNVVAKSVESHPEEKDFVLSFVPSDQQEENLLNDISQLATKANVSLFSVGFGKDGSDINDAADQSLQYIGGQIIASGSYENIKKFSEELFHMKRMYVFRGFELAKVEKNNAEGEASQEQVLSASISFAYGYIPGEMIVSATSMSKQIDYEKISAVMNSTVNTDPLGAELQQRNNPFLP